ncbi:hypothetical protein EDC94DRAFT_24790 [Helicostylum pulchrum]|nr:hypothetical protein EDC94DRAFT_24790 [Helicostylum pulchrum]
MSVIQETPCIWSDPALLDQQSTATSIVGQMQNILLIDDDEIYNDDEDDFSFLAPFSNDDDSVPVSNTNHVQYVNTVRKTRPLPKIPERSSSKGTPTEINEGSKIQNKLTARQLFEMLSDDRITDTDNTNAEKEDEMLYGGVYAFKTQLPSPHLSNKSIQHASYQYENFNTNYYKMMTPVQEVEEEQLYSYQEDTSYQDNYYNTATTTSTTDRPLSEASFNAPSLTSGRTSPSSHKSHQSVDSLNQKSDHEHAAYLDGPEANPIQPAKDESLVSDVERLAELNQALMTPVISNRNIAINHSPQPAAPSEDYSNINTASPQAMTSFSLTSNKESIKIYRRMATKTHDKNIQFTYAKYLMQLVSFHGAEKEANSTRDRLQEEVEYWIEKLAKANYAEALYIKGQWHSHCCDRSVINIFVGSQYKKVNHAKAFKCFQQAAKFGSTEAHYELAEYWKDRKEYKKALSSYKFAASKNHILALYKLANVMLRGLMNQEKDAHQGLIFLKKAADSNKPESARSAYDLACIYSNDFESIDLNKAGLITPTVTSQTCNLAVQYYKKADDLGLSLATYRLGYIYQYGHVNTVVDLPQAFKYYLKAAEKKHEGAMLEIAKFYKEGIPGFLNPHHTIAHEWCTRAAADGNQVAEFTLGIYFEYGIGVYPDHAQALSWYHKAASKGYNPAKDKLSNRSDKPKTQNIDVKANTRRSKKYYEESVRIAEKSRRVHAEQSCQIM